MTMSRQLINLAGGLAAIVIIALGVLLVALPMYNQARATEQQADETAQTNEIYDIQVTTLRAQEAELTDLETQLAALRAQIPTDAFNDQVIELIGNAVESTGVTVETVTATDPDVWTAPTAAGTEDAAESTTAPDAAADDATDPAAEGAETPADGATDPAAPAEVEPRQAVPFTIDVVADDAGQAARFIDRLRADARLLAIDNAVLTEGEDGLQLIVNARSLVLLQK